MSECTSTQAHKDPNVEQRGGKENSDREVEENLGKIPKALEFSLIINH